MAFGVRCQVGRPNRGDGLQWAQWISEPRSSSRVSSSGAPKETSRPSGPLLSLQTAGSAEPLGLVGANIGRRTLFWPRKRSQRSATLAGR